MWFFFKHDTMLYYKDFWTLSAILFESIEMSDHKIVFLQEECFAGHFYLNIAAIEI